MKPEQVLLEAAAQWKKTRSARWGRLCDWAAAAALKEKPRPVVGAGKKNVDLTDWRALEAKKDPLDVPRLVEALTAQKSPDAAEGVTVLAKRDDPLLNSALLKVLEAPPWRAQTALPFFRAAAKALAESEDGRARDAMADLAGRYKAIIETSVGDLVAALLKRTAAEMKVTAGKDEVAKLEKLEALFPEAKSEAAHAQSAQRTAKASNDELLAAIYAAPDDDGPRMVFADTLNERGDARGELIALQLRRFRGNSDLAAIQRERELCREPKRMAEWGLPLSAGGDVAFERGMPVEVSVKRTAKAIIGLPAWATVKCVRQLQILSDKMATDLLGAEVMGGIEEVEGLAEAVLAKLKAPRFGWKKVRFQFNPTAAQLERMPNLQEVRLLVYTSQPAPKDVAWPALSKVKTLELTWGQVPTAADAEHLEAEWLKLLVAPEPGVLAQMKNLKHVELPQPKSWALTEGATLESAGVTDWLSAASLRDLLSHQPGLKQVHAHALARSDYQQIFDLLRETKLQELVVARQQRWVELQNPQGASLLQRGLNYGDEDVLSKLRPGTLKKYVFLPYTADPSRAAWGARSDLVETYRAKLSAAGIEVSAEDG